MLQCPAGCNNVRTECTMLGQNVRMLTQNVIISGQNVRMLGQNVIISGYNVIMLG